MKYPDFVVKYDPKTMSHLDIAERILYSLFIRRLKFKKPTITFVSGDSGEGKSYSVLYIVMILCRILKINLADYMDVMNICTPLEYTEKLQKILFDKKYKKMSFICLHEAREVVKAKLWYNFLNQAVSDINAMSRRVKRICIFIVSQFIRDISMDIRYTLNYYIKCYRPLRESGKARITIYRVWKDDYDLEKPKLRKRLIKGYLVYPNGKRREYKPKYLELNKPPKEITEKFDEMDYESKVKIIKTKLNRLLKELKNDIGFEQKKVDTMVEWYLKNDEQIKLIGKKYRGKWKLKHEFLEMHELTKEEADEFEIKLNQKIKESKPQMLEVVQNG